MNIRHVHIVLGISGQFGVARTVVWPRPCVENACTTYIKRTHSIEYNIGLEPVRGHLRAPTSLTEYVHLTTLDKLHLADTPYIPPHR